MKPSEKVFLALQIIAFIFELWYLYTWTGTLGVLVGIFIFPVVWVALPFIMLFRSGIWLPLVITVLPMIFLFLKRKN